MKLPKKNPAAQALARLSRLNPTEAQKAASRANGLLGAEHGAKGGRPKHSTIAMLHRSDGRWWLATWKGDTIPAQDFPTAQDARIYARWKKWGVARMPDCDSIPAKKKGRKP